MREISLFQTAQHPHRDARGDRTATVRSTASLLEDATNGLAGGETLPSLLENTFPHLTPRLSERVAHWKHEYSRPLPTGSRHSMHWSKMWLDQRKIRSGRNVSNKNLGYRTKWFDDSKIFLFHSVRKMGFYAPSRINEYWADRTKWFNCSKIFFFYCTKNCWTDQF